MRTSECIRIPDANVRMSDLARFDIPNLYQSIVYKESANAITCSLCFPVNYNCYYTLNKLAVSEVLPYGHGQNDAELMAKSADPDQTALQK